MPDLELISKQIVLQENMWLLEQVSRLHRACSVRRVRPCHQAAAAPLATVRFAQPENIPTPVFLFAQIALMDSTQIPIAHRANLAAPERTSLLATG